LSPDTVLDSAFVFASDGTTEAEIVLFDKIAAEALGKPLVVVLHHRYPGHAKVDALAHPL
jgi:hypothetical protein